MPTIEITDDHRDRIETLRAELASSHAGEYASVGTKDTLTYLLDLAETVDDPDRTADPEVFDAARGQKTPESAVDDSREAGKHRERGGTPFDLNHIRDQLEARNRKHGNPDNADEMDLYAIAAAFDVTGRSGMTKAELIEAILDAAEQFAANPFTGVDIELEPTDQSAEPTNDAGDESGGNSATGDAGNDEDVDAEAPPAEGGDEADAGGSSQLDAMMSLLDTHEEKWREGDGDVRYEVDLPDGGVETARTKDDVRALLFKNY